MRALGNKNKCIVASQLIFLISLAIFEIGDGYQATEHSGKRVKDQNDELRHQYREKPDLQDQFDQIEKLRQKNREQIKDRIQRKSNGIAHRIYEEVPLTLPNNAILFSTGGGVSLKVRDSSGIQYKNKTPIKDFEDDIEDESREKQQSTSNNYITLNLNRRRRGIAVIPKTQNGHLKNANAFPNSNSNEKWSSLAPQTNNSNGASVKSLVVPTTISAKMKSTLSAQTVQNVTFLLNNLLQQYDNSLRPDLGGNPVKVDINMYVRSMGPISEMDMTYSMDCYFRQSWVDERLSFPEKTFDELALSIEMLRKIWKPDTYIYNGRRSYLHTITTPNKFVRLFPNGRVLYSQRLTIRASCQMDLSDFPMDSQRCPLNIGSFGYTVEDVVYRWTEGDGCNIEPDLELSQFDIGDISIGTRTQVINKGVHSTLIVSFHLQRHMGNFVIQVYGPCVLLVVISWVSFWLNREATSDRISLGVTTVLTMTFLGLEARTDLPQVPYPTALDYFVFISFMFIFSTVVQFAMVHHFTKLGAGEYYLEELEETICAKEVKKLAMYRHELEMCQNIKDRTTVNGAVKTGDGKETANYGKETSSTDKSENEKLIKSHNDPFSRGPSTDDDEVSFIIGNNCNGSANSFGNTNNVMPKNVLEYDDDDISKDTHSMVENDAFVGSRNAMNHKHDSSGLGHIIIPDGGVMFTTTTNATDTFHGDDLNPTSAIHLQHHHHVVNLKCGNKSTKPMNAEPINTFIGVASAGVAGAVSNGPKIPDDLGLSRNMSNPNLLDNSFQGSIQHSVQNRPSAPPLPQTYSIHHHHHVLYKACSAGSLEQDTDLVGLPEKRIGKNVQSPTLVTGEAMTESRKAYIKNNCLNHHPYGTFYYNKKSGRTGKHYYYKNLPPSPKSIIIDTPTPPLRTSSNLSGNTLKNDQIQHTKHLRHIHHNGPTSVGISETATTVQVAVQTPPSRRKGPCNAHSQTRLAKRIKKYENGIDSEQTDAKSMSQNNQITPEGVHPHDKVSSVVNTNDPSNTSTASFSTNTEIDKKFKNQEDFKLLDSNNVNASKENGSTKKTDESGDSNNSVNRTGSSLWGRARAKLGIPDRPPPRELNLNKEDEECMCKRCITRAMNNPEKALNSVSKIDKISRIVFPLAFTLLNLFYWYSYLSHSERISGLSFQA